MEQMTVRPPDGKNWERTYPSGHGVLRSLREGGALADGTDGRGAGNGQHNPVGCPGEPQAPHRSWRKAARGCRRAAGCVGQSNRSQPAPVRGGRSNAESCRIMPSAEMTIDYRSERGRMQGPTRLCADMAVGESSGKRRSRKRETIHYNRGCCICAHRPAAATSLHSGLASFSKWISCSGLGECDRVCDSRWAFGHALARKTTLTMVRPNERLQPTSKVSAACAFIASRRS